jgi:hypothetical protein
MSNNISDLVEQVLEACASPRYGQLKHMWTRHNRLEKGEKIPVCVHLHRGYTQTWRELIPPDELQSEDLLTRNIELQLRQKLFRHREIPDDDVLLPTIWMEPVRLAGSDDRLWGAPLLRAVPDDPKGAYTFLPIVENEADLAKLQYPKYAYDASATKRLIERARELVGDRLPVKLWTDQVRESPGERIIDFLGWDGFLYGLVEHPKLVHAMMDFLTEGMRHYQRDRERQGAVEAEASWLWRVHYEALPPEEAPDRLHSCWAYIAAQATGTISPAMYAEFIHPYNVRMVDLFGPHRIYYHGCEDLTPKLDIVATLPGLRRFDVGAWTDLAACVQKFERRVVLEVQVHPGDTLLVHDPVEMRKALEGIVAIAKDCIFDINLSDVETVNGNRKALGDWTRLAQEVVTK